MAEPASEPPLETLPGIKEVFDESLKRQGSFQNLLQLVGGSQTYRKYYIPTRRSVDMELALKIAGKDNWGLAMTLLLYQRHHRDGFNQFQFQAARDAIRNSQITPFQLQVADMSNLARNQAFFERVCRDMEGWTEFLKNELGSGNYKTMVDKLNINLLYESWLLGFKFAYGTFENFTGYIYSVSPSGRLREMDLACMFMKISLKNHTGTGAIPLPGIWIFERRAGYERDGHGDVLFKKFVHDFTKFNGNVCVIHPDQLQTIYREYRLANIGKRLNFERLIFELSQGTRM